MSADITGIKSGSQTQDRTFYEIDWAGTGVSGSIEFEISDDEKTWTTLEFGQTIPLATDTGSHQILISDSTWKYIRPVYRFVAGTGLINISFRGKAQGA